MSIAFDRNRAQVSYENFVEITSIEDFRDKNKQTNFKNHQLTSEEVLQLNNDLKEDAVDFFYSGIISFAEGIDSIFQKRFSWATVKLYYSLFYLIRASLATKGYAILRCNSMFRLKIAVNESPYTKRGKEFNSTHDGILNHHKDLFNLSDLLLSNKIDELDAYEWMKNAREIVNYRSRSFLEPECLDIWDHFSQCVDDGTIFSELQELEDDDYTKCFQEEYAVVGIPIKRMQQTIADMADAGFLHLLDHNRDEYARGFVNNNGQPISILSAVFTEESNDGQSLGSTP